MSSKVGFVQRGQTSSWPFSRPALAAFLSAFAFSIWALCCWPMNDYGGWWLWVRAIRCFDQGLRALKTPLQMPRLLPTRNFPDDLQLRLGLSHIDDNPHRHERSIPSSPPKSHSTTAKMPGGVTVRDVDVSLRSFSP
jgi:hypothetical protein